MNDAVTMVYDILNRWPLEMWFPWLIVLFFTSKIIHLGRLGLLGRGIPVTSSRHRWAGVLGGGLASLMIAFGVGLAGCFAYWLVHAVFVRISGD